MKNWEAGALLFNGQTAREGGERRAQVLIYREVSEVPPGKKRAVKRRERVLDAVMSRGAWQELSRVLQIAGCAVSESERPW